MGLHECIFAVINENLQEIRHYHMLQKGFRSILGKRWQIFIMNFYCDTRSCVSNSPF